MSTGDIWEEIHDDLIRSHSRSPAHSRSSDPDDKKSHKRRIRPSGSRSLSPDDKRSHEARRIPPSGSRSVSPDDKLHKASRNPPSRAGSKADSHHGQHAHHTTLHSLPKSSSEGLPGYLLEILQKAASEYSGPNNSKYQTIKESLDKVDDRFKPFKAGDLREELIFYKQAETRRRQRELDEAIGKASVGIESRRMPHDLSQMFLESIDGYLVEEKGESKMENTNWENIRAKLILLDVRFEGFSAKQFRTKYINRQRTEKSKKRQLGSHEKDEE